MCMMYVGVQVHSVTYEYLVVSASLLKRLFFPPLNSLGVLAKNKFDMNMRHYFWILSSIPLFHMSVFMPEPHCLDYGTFALSFKIRKIESSKFFFQDCFGCSNLLHFHVNFRICLSISAKKAARILVGVLLIT